MDLPIVLNEEVVKSKKVHFYDIIESKTADFDFLKSMAARICNAATAMITLIGEEEKDPSLADCFVTTKSYTDYPYCTYALSNNGNPLVVEDSRNDPRFMDQRINATASEIIFYAGVPLINENGLTWGVFSVIDHKPNKLEAEQLAILTKLAKQAVNTLAYHKKELEATRKNDALKKSLALLEETQAMHKIGSWELNIETGKTTWNDIVYQIHEVPFGFDHNKLNGIDFYHPDYRSLISSSIQKCIDHNERFDIVCLLITAKGNQKWVRSTGRKAENKVLGSFQDITDIKKNEIKFKGIFNSTFTFIGFLNTKGILLEANDTAVNMAGITHEDVIGKYFWDCYWWQISEQTKATLKANFEKALSGIEVVYEVAVWIANHTPITILFSLKPLFDEQGKVIYIIPEGRPVQEIINARNRYKAVIEGTNVGTWEWDVPTGKAIYNDRWAEIFGLSLEEIYPHHIDTWLQSVHPDELEAFNERLRKCFEKEEAFFEAEVRMLHKNKNWVWGFIRGKVFDWTDEGKPLKMYGTLKDITERKNNEEALRRSEEAFRGNFENAATGMALVDTNGKWLKVNKKLCEILGYSEQELYTFTFQDLTYADDLNNDLRLLNQLIKGDTDSYQMEKRYIHKNGNIVYVILAVSTVKAATGEILYFISQIIDISQLKHAESGLKNLLASNKAILDATTEVALISIDFNGNVLSTNVGTQILLGYPSDNIIGRNFQQTIMLQHECESATKEIKKSNGSGKNNLLLYALIANENKQKFREWTFRKLDGSFIPVIMSVSPIQSEDNLHGYLIAATDITYIKLMQAQLKQKNDELQQFAHVAAHDLQAPLRTITTYLSMFQMKYNDQLNEHAKGLIQNAMVSGKRMKLLINDILDFSKSGIVGKDAIDLNEIIQSILENYQLDEQYKNLKINKGALPIVKGNMSSFMQLLSNLINNAIKYQPKNNIPEISIFSEEELQSWIISVADNGIGIDPVYQEKVFEVFKRLHSNSEYSGTGIGLATCKKIVSAYGGQIWFEPNEPHGTIFKFSLPKSFATTGTKAF